MKILPDKKHIFETSSSVDSVESYLSKGDLEGAANWQKKKNKLLVGDQLEKNVEAFMDLERKEASVENTKRMRKLRLERDNLLKFQEYVEDHETVNNNWYNQKITGLKQKFGKDIPPEELEKVQNIYNEANSYGFSLRVSKLEKEVNNMVVADSLSIEKLVQDKQYAEAMTKIELTVSNLRELHEAGFYTDKQLKNQEDALRDKFTERLGKGVVQDTLTVMQLEGFDAAESYWNENSKVLKKYTDKGSDDLKLLVDKQEKLFKAAKDDSDFKYKSLDLAYETAKATKHQPIGAMQGIVSSQMNLLKGKLSDPQLQPKERTGIKNQMKILKGRQTLLWMMNKGLKGEDKYKDLISGMPTQKLIGMSGLKSMEAVAALVKDYQDFRRGYKWDKDYYGSLYKFHKNMNQEFMPPGDDSILNIASDQLNISKRYGKPGLGNAVADGVAKFFNSPFTPESEKKKIVDWELAHGLGLGELINKKHDTTLDKTVWSVGNENQDVFDNINYSKFPDWEAYKSKFKDRKGAKADVEKLARTILAKQNPFGETYSQDYRERLSRVAEALGGDSGKYALNIALNFYERTHNSQTGGLSFRNVKLMGEAELREEDEFSSFVEDKIEKLENKFTKLGRNYVYKDEEDPLQYKRGIFGKVWDLFSGGGDEAAEDKARFMYSLTQDTKGVGIKKDSLSLPYQEQVQTTIRELTGIKNLDTIGRLAITPSPDRTGYHLQVLDKYDVKQDLFYKNSQKTKQLFIHKGVFKDTMGELEDMSESDFVEFIKLVLLESMDL